MFPNYLAVGKRCVVELNSLKLPISNGQALDILMKIYFQIVEVDLIGLARECIGKSEYRRGAPIHEAPQQMDCSSFMKWLYAQRGIRLPRRSIQQREMGICIELPDLSAGDLVFVSGCINYFFDNPGDGVGHVGIATGQSTVVHAANSKMGVTETEISEFIEKGFRGAKRIIPDDADVLTLIVPPAKDVESSDDLRWIILQNLDKL